MNKQQPGVPQQIHEELHIEAPVRHIVQPQQYTGKLNSSGTPSVLNVNCWKCVEVAPRNITYFDRGQAGQTIHVLGDGNTTVVFDAGLISTNTGADKLLEDKKLYTFTNIDGVWYEHE